MTLASDGMCDIYCVWMVQLRTFLTASINHNDNVLPAPLPPAPLPPRRFQPAPLPPPLYIEICDPHSLCLCGPRIAQVHNSDRLQHAALADMRSLHPGPSSLELTAVRPQRAPPVRLTAKPEVRLHRCKWSLPMCVKYTARSHAVCENMHNQRFVASLFFSSHCHLVVCIRVTLHRFIAIVMSTTHKSRYNTESRVVVDTSRCAPEKSSLSRLRPSAPLSVMSLSSARVNNLMLTSRTSVNGMPSTFSGTAVMMWCYCCHYMSVSKL